MRGKKQKDFNVEREDRVHNFAKKRPIPLFKHQLIRTTAQNVMHTETAQWLTHAIDWATGMMKRYTGKWICPGCPWRPPISRNLHRTSTSARNPNAWVIETNILMMSLFVGWLTKDSGFGSRSEWSLGRKSSAVSSAAPARLPRRKCITITLKMEKS